MTITVAVTRAVRFWLAWTPAVLAVLGMLYVSVSRPRRLIDLHFAFLPAARAVAHGASPYAGAYGQLRWIGSAYIYPPPIAFAAVPLIALPPAVAAAVFTALMVAAAAGALWLLGVRDWRCYALVLVSHPMLASELAGALSALVLVLVAAAWRWRDSSSVVGVMVALAVVTKLFCWPLVVWLLVTRRMRAAATATITGAVLIAGSWAAIGFAGLGGYPQLLGWVTATEASDSYSVASLLAWGGVSLRLGEAVGVILALIVLAAAARAGERVVFLAAVAAALLASPIVWAHYFVLLVVPCALGWPRLAAAWFLLLGGWLLFAHENVAGSLAALLGYQVIAAGLFAWASSRAYPAVKRVAR